MACFYPEYLVFVLAAIVICVDSFFSDAFVNNDWYFLFVWICLESLILKMPIQIFLASTVRFSLGLWRFKMIFEDPKNREHVMVEAKKIWMGINSNKCEQQFGFLDVSESQMH